MVNKLNNIVNSDIDDKEVIGNIKSFKKISSIDIKRRPPKSNIPITKKIKLD